MAYEWVPDPKTNSPSALIETNTFLITDTTLYVDHVEYFPDATSDKPGIAVLGRGEDCETITYTGKTGTSGSGTLTGITREVDKETIGGVEFGTKKQWEIGDDVACVLTAYHLKKLIANATRNTPVTSTSDPTVDDDSGDGYEVGKVWINTSSDEAFVCLDNSSGAAVWASISNLLNNYSASVDPTVDDDSGDGYSVGSLWFNTTDDKAFVCLDASSGAAVWHQIDVTTFIGLSDTPAAFTDQGNKIVKVNSGASALEFIHAKYQIILHGSGGWASTTDGDSGFLKTELTTNDVDIKGISFPSSAAAAYHQWHLPMPGNYDGSTVTAIFYWTTHDSTPSGDVSWKVQWQAYGNDDPLDAAWGSAIEVVDTIIAQNDQHISVASGAITGGNTPVAGDNAAFRVYRDGADASDTSSNDVVLQYVVLLYGTNSPTAG